MKLEEKKYIDENENKNLNFTKLDNIIFDILLPNYLLEEKIKLKNNFIDIPTIQLKKLKTLNLEENEIEYLVKNLNKMGIYVIGINDKNELLKLIEESGLDINELESLNREPNTSLTYEEQLNLFKEMTELKEKEDYNVNLDYQKRVKQIREKLIIENMNLVKYVNYIFSRNYDLKMNYDEIKDFGVIGLIKSVDSFDYRLGYKFSSYAYKSIFRETAAEKLSELGFKNLEEYSDYMTAKKEIEEAYLQDGIIKEIDQKEIVEIMKMKFPEKYDKRFNNLYLRQEVSNSIDIDSVDENKEQLVDDYSLNEDVELSFSKQELMDLIKNELTEKEQDIIIKHFGLDNEPIWTLEQLGKKYNVSSEAIRTVEKNAKKKIYFATIKKQSKSRYI